MTRLPQALGAWGTTEFSAVLKRELEGLDPKVLPLQEGVSRGSYVSGDCFEAMIITASDVGDAIVVRAGIHYRSIIAGCSCADDPTPVDELSEYCEVEILLDKTSGAARVRLLDD